MIPFFHSFWKLCKCCHKLFKICKRWFLPHFFYIFRFYLTDIGLNIVAHPIGWDEKLIFNEKPFIFPNLWWILWAFNYNFKFIFLSTDPLDIYEIFIGSPLSYELHMVIFTQNSTFLVIFCAIFEFWLIECNGTYLFGFIWIFY